MYKKPYFWIIFTSIAVICTIFVFKFFPLAFPMIDLELTMDRKAALQKAQEINEKYNLSPDGYREAAFFILDGLTMFYVELEAGGTEAFREMLKDSLYAPYYWRVRHFKENEIDEVSYYFTPTSELIGFRRKLPEDTQGAALVSDSALTIAFQLVATFN